MPHEIRTLATTDELEQALSVFYTSLVGFPGPTGGDLQDYYEPGRCIGILEAGRVVATGMSFTSWLSVPGGTRLPHCAITDLGVLPTHTRQGMAQELISHQLQDAARRGEPVATLRASEATIYERFGFGVATGLATAEVITARAALRPGVPAGGPVRLADPASSWDDLARIYETVNRPGAIDRGVYWWRGQQHYSAQRSGAAYLALHGEPGAEDGFARYRPLNPEDWFSGRPRRIVVSDLVAGTDQAYTGLLRFLFSIDLVDVVELFVLPVDHGLPDLLLDARAVSTTRLRDETWLRLVDVLAALDARAYRGPGSVVLQVSDAQLPQNTGRYLVSSAGAQRTDAEPDLETDVSALAAAYLGGTPWWQQARAGRVTELGAGALATADRLFGTARAPFAGTSF